MDTWYQAIVSRDPRFDGVFFVAVSTTGIYCRPVCPARTPRRDRVTFYRRAAEAERDGYRACFRCRPELAPGNSAIDARSRLTAAATARIESGGEGSLEDIARELNVTSRHLRRVLGKELGLSPVELAQSKRIGLAKQLLHDTALPIADIAFASGFRSVRRFNALFRDRFGRPPSQVRKSHGANAESGIVLRLDHRPPFDWASLLEFLGARAIPGVEVIENDTYRRTVRVDGKKGFVSVRPDGKRNAVRAEISHSLAPVLLPVAARLRSLFDLDAHPAAVADHLGRDRALRPLVKLRPGLRLPGAFDGFEMAVRAILGQQVTVKGATTLSGRFVEALATKIETPHEGLRFVFPDAHTVARSAFSIGMPAARASAVRALARACDRDLVLAPHAEAETTIERLLALPGIGPWTAHYIAMRALHWPDAWPGGDLVLKREAPNSDSWRPWRAYGAMHIWRNHVGDDQDTSKRLRAVGDR
jgi:AraC family transcriptional regulator of adaptative response / DNA-3-methyladenine glycosylase II